MKRLWAILFMLTLSSWAQLNSNLKEEFQPDDAHGMRIISRVQEIHSSISDPKTKILALQLWGEPLTFEAQQELLAWIQSGKTLWFYDARLAPQFGMEPYYLNAQQFRNKPEKGVLGSSKRAGLACVAISFGHHAVQTSVGQVTTFLPEIATAGDDTLSYGAIAIKKDTVALLQFALDSPAIMALRREGRGLIVFKTLLWNEPLSGDRFQHNLLDFSAGYQVPGEAGAGRVGSPPGPTADYVIGDPAIPLDPSLATKTIPPTPNTPPTPPSSQRANLKVPQGLHWIARLKDGSEVVGQLENNVIEFETSSSSLKLKSQDLLELELGGNLKLDRITTQQGTTQSGVLTTSVLQFRTDQGLQRLDKDDLERLEYRPSMKEQP